jgi:hypothetical protein
MYNLTNANKHFEDVKILRSKIEGDFTIINTKLKALRKIYSEIVIKHSKIDCTLGVDALFFQSELIDKEYSNLQQLFNFINNRIYCEYYKLYYYIKDYIESSIATELSDELKMAATFPAYKSLDTSIVYDFGCVLQMQSQIVDILNRLDKYFKENVSVNNTEKKLLQMGLHIDTVIHTQDYMNSVMKSKIAMFCHYLETFNTHHRKHLNRLHAKTEMIVNIISDDMQLHEFSSKNNNTGEAAENNATKNSDDESVPGDDESIPNVEDSVPPDESVPNAEESVPNADEAVPNAEESVPVDESVKNNDNEEYPIINEKLSTKTTIDTSGDSQKLAKSVVDAENINFAINR